MAKIQFDGTCQRLVRVLQIGVAVTVKGGAVLPLGGKIMAHEETQRRTFLFFANY